MHAVFNPYCKRSTCNGCYRVLCPGCGSYLAIHCSTAERAVGRAEEYNQFMHLCSPTTSPLSHLDAKK